MHAGDTEKDSKHRASGVFENLDCDSIVGPALPPAPAPALRVSDPFLGGRDSCSCSFPPFNIQFTRQQRPLDDTGNKRFFLLRLLLLLVHGLCRTTGIVLLHSCGVPLPRSPRHGHHVAVPFNGIK